ncbi:hypothetical protein AJ79_10359 [Helicocarpus griseus UAMH5409]|uniref:Uncharacterized protein n=1 Tax=Helicocarpus griseus UAMH5409 TaxID=1447875 RepID=A0A2B7W5Z1_9EURO|nr:hypothetical protein AJ79_10359 [Helicocarpus griseus UAMH5409]
MAEPWPITEKIGNFYHDSNKSLSEQVPDSPPSIEMNGELEYDVDEVIAVRT